MGPSTVAPTHPNTRNAGHDFWTSRIVLLYFGPPTLKWAYPNQMPWILPFMQFVHQKWVCPIIGHVWPGKSSVDNLEPQGVRDWSPSKENATRKLENAKICFMLARQNEIEGYEMVWDKGPTSRFIYLKHSKTFQNHAEGCGEWLKAMKR
jgi:hypothetical protein